MKNKDILVITHWNSDGINSFLKSLNNVIAKGCGIIQLRLPGVTKEDYSKIAQLTSDILSEKNISLFLNCNIEDIPKNVNAAGIHLKSEYAAKLTMLPPELKNKYIFSTPCHNYAEIKRANDLGFDFGIITPIRQSFLYPDKKILGWDNARKILKGSSIPMYAAGGLTETDLDYVKKCGFHGIAGVGSFFN